MKTCEQCGKEYKPRVPDQKYCCKQCRWDYNNALKQSASNTQKSVYTPLHASDGTQKDSPTIARLEAKIDRLYAIIERQQTTIELMALSQAASPKGGASGKEQPIAPKPIDTSDLVVEVKKSAKQDGNVQATNFLNSIMALNG